MMYGVASVSRLGRCDRVVDGAAGRRLPFLADPAREVALGIDVDQQHALIGQRE